MIQFFFKSSKFFLGVHATKFGYIYLIYTGLHSCRIANFEIDYIDSFLFQTNNFSLLNKTIP